MIYYFIRTADYLKHILNAVSRHAEYYQQFDIALDKAKPLIDKFNQRYTLNKTPQQKQKTLMKKPALDLLVLCNNKLYQQKQVRLCLLVTMDNQHKAHNNAELCSALIHQHYKNPNGKEKFYSVHERNNRLIYHAVNSTLKVYELVYTPYSVEYREKIKSDKHGGWSWRMHKEFYEFKVNELVNAYKKAQKLQDPAKQHKIIADYLNQLHALFPARLVKEQIFEITKKCYSFSHQYLNRPFENPGKKLPKISFNKNPIDSFEDILAHYHHPQD